MPCPGSLDTLVGSQLEYRLYSVASFEKAGRAAIGIWSVENGGDFPIAAFSPDGKTFAVLGRDSRIVVRLLRDPSVIVAILPSPQTTIVAMDYRNGFNQLLVSQHGGPVQLWNIDAIVAWKRRLTD